MVEFLCLANSWREGARCVAGLVPGRGWVRPVPDDAGSAVPTTQCRHFGILDVVDVDLGVPVPIEGQRENTLLGPEAFSDVREHNPARLREDLEGLVEERPRFLAIGRPDRISADEVHQRRIGQSLALVEPAEVQWSTDTNRSGRRRVRCHFNMGWDNFDLVVTDPEFAPKALATLQGTPLYSLHENGLVGIAKDQRLLITVSLGGEHDGNHFKLVAGVFTFGK